MTETFGTLAEARDAKQKRERGAKLARGHAAGLHLDDPREGCPECEREQGRRARSFERFAWDWYDEHEHEWSERTRTDYRWRLANHLVP